MITGVVLSDANQTFAQHRADKIPPGAAAQTDTEYGWKDDVTLFAATESAYVEVAQGGAPYTAFDQAAEGGRFGCGSTAGWGWKISAPPGGSSLRTAGAFNFAISANRSAGRQQWPVAPASALGAASSLGRATCLF